MKTKAKWFFISLGLVFLLGCVQYKLSPEEINVNSGNSFTVDVSLENCLQFPFIRRYRFWCADISDVYGVGFDLNYDSSVIRFQSVSLTGSVLSGVTSLTGFRNSSNDNGKLVVGISKQGQVSGQSGKGKIATISFQAIAQGNTEINFADPHLVNSQGKFLVGWPYFLAGLGKASVSVSPP